MRHLKSPSHRACRRWLRYDVRARVKIIVRKDHGYPRHWRPKKASRRWVWKRPEFEWDE